MWEDSKEDGGHFEYNVIFSFPGCVDKRGLDDSMMLCVVRTVVETEDNSEEVNCGLAHLDRGFEPGASKMPGGGAVVHEVEKLGSTGCHYRFIPLG